MTVSADFFGRDYRTMEDPNHPAIVRNDRARSTARADSVEPKLVLHERLDDSGRKIREWSGDKLVWMRDFMSPPQRMVVLDNQGRGLAWAEKRMKQILADEAQLAAQITKGGIESVRCDIGA